MLRRALRDPFSPNAKENPELIVYDNKEGNPPARTDIWHSDESWRECPALGTILCSKIIPALGGDTAFHSMTAAYDGLSDRMQHFISTGRRAMSRRVAYREATSSRSGRQEEPRWSWPRHRRARALR